MRTGIVIRNEWCNIFGFFLDSCDDFWKQIVVYDYSILFSLHFLSIFLWNYFLRIYTDKIISAVLQNWNIYIYINCYTFNGYFDIHFTCMSYICSTNVFQKKNILFTKKNRFLWTRIKKVNHVVLGYPYNSDILLTPILYIITLNSSEK